MKSTKIILVAILLFAVINIVFAKEYVGISLGNSTINLEGYNQGFFYKAYAGVRKKYYGFEGSYTRLANFDITGDNIGVASSSGIEAAGITFLPLTNNLELFVKIGFFTWSATGTVNGGFIPKNRGSDLTYSAGAQYNVAEKVTLRAEYQKFRGVLGGDITSASSGLSYRF